MVKNPKIRIKKGKEKFFQPDVANIREKKDIEEEKFLISFGFYNNDECQINNLDRRKPHELLHKLKKISNLTSFLEFYDSGINTTIVKNRNDYKRFCKTVPVGYKTYEDEIQGTARLFYFIMEKIFYVVCITNTHPETRKTRR